MFKPSLVLLCTHIWGSFHCSMERSFSCHWSPNCLVQTLFDSVLSMSCLHFNWREFSIGRFSFFFFSECGNNCFIPCGIPQPLSKLCGQLNPHSFTALGCHLHSLAFSSGWKARCAEYFPHSTYFGGPRSLAVSHCAGEEIYNAPENGGVNHHQAAKCEDIHSLNGNVVAFKDLTI